MTAQCIVKGCGNRRPEHLQLCGRCHAILTKGVLLSSPAWFVTELEFLNQQNHFAMEQVRKLHDKVNELMGEDDGKE